MRYNVIIIAALVILTAISCIKEDRSGCPCHLHVDLSRVDSNYVHSMSLMMDRNGGNLAEWIPVDKSIFGDTLIIAVDKAEFDFCAWGNLSHSIIDNKGRIISPGDFPDSLWSDYRRISTKCEDVYLSVQPERQFIPVTIIVRGMIAAVSELRPEIDNISEQFHFSGSATGASNAILPTLVGTPAPGREYYLFKTLLMTQPSATEATLNLGFVSAGHSYRSTFPLGQMLLEKGEDLSLSGRNPVILDLTIGSANIFIKITVDDWTTLGVFEINY